MCDKKTKVESKQFKVLNKSAIIKLNTTQLSVKPHRQDMWTLPHPHWLTLSLEREKGLSSRQWEIGFCWLHVKE